MTHTKRAALSVVLLPILLWFTSFSPSPTSVHAAFTSPAEFYFKATVDTSDADLRTWARRVKMVFHAKAQQAQVVKDESAGVLVLYYDIPGGIFTGESDYAYVDNHEAWFVHDTSGSRLTEGGRDGVWLLNVNHSEYRQYEIAQTLDALNAAPYDGLFLDVSHPIWVKRRHWRDQRARRSSPPAGVVNDWPDWMLAYHEDLRAMTAGRIYIWNNWAVAPGGYREYPTHFDRTLAVGDGVQFDGSLYALTKPYATRVWEWQISSARMISGQGKWVLIKIATDVPNIVLPLVQEFGFASYLLVAGPKVLFRHIQSGRGEWNEQLFRAPLGKPLGPYTASGGIYRRDFANGIAVVNPSTTDGRTVQLGGTYYTLSGKAFTAVLLLPVQGAVLLKTRL